MAKEKFNIGTNLDDNNKVELTSQGKKDLEVKLREFIDVQRPKVQVELAEARAQGDLSENAEYDAAKNKQAEIEAEIARIENILTRAKIIKTSSSSTEIHLGSTIKYKKGSKEYEASIVPEAEYDPLSEPIKIGANTPFAQSVMGAEVGDEVVIPAEKKYKITILNIK